MVKPTRSGSRRRTTKSTIPINTSTLQEKYKLSNCASVLLEHNLLENSFAVLFRYVLALRYNPFSIFYFIKIFFKNIKNTIFLL